MDNLLEVKNLKVFPLTPAGVVHGVRDVSLEISEGETVGLVGESGCGKTLTAKAVIGLHDRRRTDVSGEILFKTKSGAAVDITKAKQSELSRLRGREISMVLQDSFLALSPIISVGRQMEDAIIASCGVKRREAGQMAAKLLSDVGIDRPEIRLKSLPGELSGGQLQRICIAMAISGSPRLLIADEPTTALDAVSQAQILRLLKRLSEEKNMAVLIVTHNFSVVKNLCDRVYVMYAGKVAESGRVFDVVKNPAHRYTQGLLDSIPELGPKKRLKPVPGQLPDVYSEISGCPYFDRCPYAEEDCTKDIPIRDLGNGHFAACRHGGDGGE